MRARITRLFDDIGTYAVEVTPDTENEALILELTDKIATERGQTWTLGIVAPESDGPGVRAFVFVPKAVK